MDLEVDQNRWIGVKYKENVEGDLGCIGTLLFRKPRLLYTNSRFVTNSPPKQDREQLSGTAEWKSNFTSSR